MSFLYMRVLSLDDDLVIVYFCAHSLATHKRKSEVWSTIPDHGKYTFRGYLVVSRDDYFPEVLQCRKIL